MTGARISVLLKKIFAVFLAISTAYSSDFTPKEISCRKRTLFGERLRIYA